jgi:glycosyltransferase involved in cell wall biosynthesis
MKIAYLTPEYPHTKTGSSGGIGTSIKNLAVGLLALGCEVRILMYGQKEDSVFEENGVVVQQIKNVKLKGLSWWLTCKKLERIINQLYNNQEIDLVEAPDWTGITSFIKPKKCPIVIKLHGSDTYFCHLDQRPVKWHNRFLEKRALQKADALLAVSKFTADKTNEIFGLKKPFTIIPNSIDLGSFKYDLNATIQLNTILYFGSLIRKKGLLELSLIFNEVIKGNPKAKLILIGRDVPDIMSGTASTWDMMQAMFSREAIENVSYLGRVPYAEMQKHINDCTICVFPSFAEALPVSWIEAMAMEKAIVTSNIGWANEMIEDGKEGFLVVPTNHEVYADRILELLNDVEKREQFGKAAREKVKTHFSHNLVAKRSIAFYKSIIYK